MNNLKEGWDFRFVRMCGIVLVVGLFAASCAGQPMPCPELTLKFCPTN